MNAEDFVGTNVLLYTIDEDPASASKRHRAQQLLLSERWGWSVQVAAEFFVNATSRKRPFRLSAPDAASLVETWLTFPTLELTADLFRAASPRRTREGRALTRPGPRINVGSRSNPEGSQETQEFAGQQPYALLTSEAI